MTDNRLARSTVRYLGIPLLLLTFVFPAEAVGEVINKNIEWRDNRVRFAPAAGTLCEGTKLKTKDVYASGSTITGSNNFTGQVTLLMRAKPAQPGGLGGLTGSAIIGGLDDFNVTIPDLTQTICVRQGGFNRGVECGCDEVCPCEFVAVPAVSQWGLVAMILLVMTAGTLVLVRKRPVA